MGNGGTGAFNNCAGQGWSMFPGPYTEEIWGKQYGGCDYRDSSQGSPSCDDLPPYPQDPSMMQAEGETLVDLCKQVRHYNFYCHDGPVGFNTGSESMKRWVIDLSF